jgi:hypothetical protein
MKRSLSFSFIALAGLVLIVGLACAVTSKATPTPVPPPVQPTLTDVPTVAVPPTKIVLPTLRPTDTPKPTVGPMDFFTEDFLKDPGDTLWSLLLIGPGQDNEDKLETSFEDGTMRFEIKAKDMYVYYFYEPYTYEDVRLDLKFENIGVNSQNIGLVCRASDNTWYEFSVGSDGYWYLYAYDDGNYETLAMAGAASLNMGHATNLYTMVCEGDAIHMYVNDVELPYSPFKPLNYFYTDGQVGFNISSLNVTPVIAEIDWFKISQP